MFLTKEIITLNCGGLSCISLSEYSELKLKSGKKKCVICLMLIKQTKLQLCGWTAPLGVHVVNRFGSNCKCYCYSQSSESERWLPVVVV